MYVYVYAVTSLLLWEKSTRCERSVERVWREWYTHTTMPMSALLPRRDTTTGLAAAAFTLAARYIMCVVRARASFSLSLSFRVLSFPPLLLKYSWDVARRCTTAEATGYNGFLHCQLLLGYDSMIGWNLKLSMDKIIIINTNCQIPERIMLKLPIIAIMLEFLKYIMWYIG